MEITPGQMMEMNNTLPTPNQTADAMTADERTGRLCRFGFRFLTIYLVLVNLPLLWIASYSETWVDHGYSSFWKAIVPSVAGHILGMPDAYSNPSFTLDDSDSWFAWIRWECYLAIALVAALVWVWFDVRRRHDGLIREWLRIYVRYALVAAMLNYGVLKVFLLQFPKHDLNWMALRFGELSPYMLMWGFIGHSNAYQAFAGIIEVIGGILLLFRSTTTLGALVVAGVMTNVVMLDFCYDVPVKLSSMNLLFFAIYLTVPDLRRLANVLVFNRAAEPASLTPVWHADGMRKAARVTKLIALGFLFHWNVFPVMQQAAENRNAPRSELHGLYTVETFTRNGQDVPPLMTDTNRWLEVKFAKDGNLAVVGMSRQLLFRHSSNTIVHEKADATHGTLRIQPRPKRSPSGEETKPSAIRLAYKRPAPDQLLIEGRLDVADISVLLHRINENEFPLRKQKFCWVGR